MNDANGETKNTPEYWIERARKKKEDFERYTTELNLNTYKSNAMHAIRDLLGEADSLEQSGLAVSAEMNAYFPDSFKDIYLLDEFDEKKFISCLNEYIIIEGGAAERLKNAETMEKEYEIKNMDVVVPIIGKESIKNKKGYPKNEKIVIGAIELIMPKNPEHESYEQLLSYHQKLAGRIGYSLHEDFSLKDDEEIKYHLENLNELLAHDSVSYLSTMHNCATLISLETREMKEDEHVKKIKNLTGAIIENIFNSKNLHNFIASENPSLLRKKLMEMKSVDAKKIIENTIKVCKSGFENYGGKKTEYETEFCVDKAFVLGSELYLQSLYRNLITNGIKYGNGYMRIGIVDGGDFFDTYVYTNGKGIEKKYYDKIFQKRFRLGSDKSGLGVGLSIVKKAVDMHKGKIYPDSGDDYNVFHVELPKAL